MQRSTTYLAAPRTRVTASRTCLAALSDRVTVLDHSPRSVSHSRYRVSDLPRSTERSRDTARPLASQRLGLALQRLGLASHQSTSRVAPPRTHLAAPRTGIASVDHSRCSASVSPRTAEDSRDGAEVPSPSAAVPPRTPSPFSFRFGFSAARSRVFDVAAAVLMLPPTAKGSNASLATRYAKVALLPSWVRGSIRVGKTSQP